MTSSTGESTITQTPLYPLLIPSPPALKWFLMNKPLLAPRHRLRVSSTITEWDVRNSICSCECVGKQDKANIATLASLLHHPSQPVLHQSNNSIRNAKFLRVDDNRRNCAICTDIMCMFAAPGREARMSQLPVKPICKQPVLEAT